MFWSQSLPRLFLIPVFLYLVTIGATFNGVLTPRFQSFTLGLMLLLVVLWQIVRWRKAWRWHFTPYDRVFLIWGLAFVISLLANPETFRRSLIGLWYMLVYIGVWFGLHDALANRALQRKTVVDILLITGLVVLMLGYVQVGREIQNDTWVLTESRPVSFIGNVNALAAFLLVLIPFAASRSISARRIIPQIAMGMYALLAIGLLILTFSRGAWAGLMIALIVLTILNLKRNDSLSLQGIGLLWQSRSVQVKTLIVAVSLIILIGMLVAGTWLVQSLSVSGRTLNLRTHLWESALSQFAEKPLSGQGLFSFGRDFALGTSMPPMQPHSHAHSIPLHIAAEMGLPGIVALIASIAVALRVIRQNWRAMSQREQPLLVGAIAALCGFGTQHLIDIPAMMPLIALSGLLVLVLATAPVEPQTIASGRRGQVHSLGFLGLWVGILIAGFWSNGNYSRYFDTVQQALTSKDYLVGAQTLQMVIDSDPMMPIYHMEQAYLWGLAAGDGDVSAAEQGIEAYDRFLELEPFHAVSWANKAALHWQVGETQFAIEAINRAIELAPDYEFFQRNLRVYNGEAVETIKPPEYVWGPNIGRFQFLREVPAEQFLPQTGWGSK